MSIALLRRLELLSLGLGSAAAVLYVALSLPAVWARNSAIVQAKQQDGAVIPQDALSAAYIGNGKPIRPSSVIAKLSIPALHLEAPVVEGVDDASLRRGVGHMPGTALAGGLGNVILAAHRDGIFRPVEFVHKGMDIAVDGGEGVFHYTVDSTTIVSPEQLDVLGIGTSPEVTLITCYPFHFIGHAPKRFVVKAHLVSALPDARR